jgi:hypothetical protein
MHHFQAYADDVNLLGDNINFIRKNTGTLIDANKEAGQNHDIKMLHSLNILEQQ